jgi:hypothetical protein
MGVDFDALGVPVVSAGGKAELDALHQLYDGLGFPVFLLFDNGPRRSSRRDTRYSSPTLRGR